MKSLIASNTIADEIERANIFQMNGKWYLFTDSRGAKMTIDGIDDKQVCHLNLKLVEKSCPTWHIYAL